MGVAAQAQSPGGEVREIAERYFDDLIALSPTYATKTGDHRYDDRLEDSATAAYQQQELQIARRYAKLLCGVQESALDESSHVVYELLAYKLKSALGRERFPDYLFSFDQIQGMPATLAVYGSGAGAQPLKTVGEYETFVRRAAEFPRWVDHAIASLRDGLRRGISLPKPVAERMAGSLHTIASGPVESSPFWKPIAEMPESIAERDRKPLTAKWRETMTARVLPSYARLETFMREEYVPHARTSVGWEALPNGTEWYRHRILEATTVDLVPERVHAQGLQEVARLRGEMDKVRVRVGFAGDLGAFLRYVQTDPRFYFKTGAEMVTAYREVKTKTDAGLPTLFRLLPRTGYEVREMEPYRATNTPGGQYLAAPPDKSRPGIFYVNTHDLMGLPNYITESLLLHEGSPGHHLQVEIARELTDVPRLSRYEFISSFAEGWALYAETLGKDLGLYTDPYQWYGHLTEQMLRAMRMVVDTGLHTKGWTREQAIDYMLANSSMARESIEIEVDRYMVWPGQALSYQTGKLKILELRDRAARQLGLSFDIREFHAQVVGSGPMPLGALERKIDRWIAANRAWNPKRAGHASAPVSR